MDSLLSPKIGFFDKTKSSNLTSRLTSDTSVVGEQVTLRANVILRSTAQAISVLLCMFFLSWQFILIAFISVPCLTFIATKIGQYLRLLKKVMQKKVRLLSFNQYLFIFLSVCRWQCHKPSIT